MSKKDVIKKKIKYHFEKQLYVRIKRGLKNNYCEIVRGYILKYSNDFILIKEENDFVFCGFHIIPISHIKNIRYNKNDEYCDFINKSEHSKSEFIMNFEIEIDLTSWFSVFNSLKKRNETIISECEKFKHELFCIGSIKEIDEKSIFIEHFNAQGYIDKELVQHKFKWITKVTFRDNYSKIFSKYTRKRNE